MRTRHDDRFLPAGGRRPLRLGADRRGERPLGRLRHGRDARSRPSTSSPGRRTALPRSIAAEVLRGGRAVTDEAGCVLARGAQHRDATPTYGLAVTGVANPDRLLRNDAARRRRPDQPHQAARPRDLEQPPQGDRRADPRSGRRHGHPEPRGGACGARRRDRAATDVTGFGLLGHLYKMARASGVTAVIDAGAVPYLERARPALAPGYVPGGTRRNLDWVAPHLSSELDEDELLLLADAQTSGGLLVAGELPGSRSSASSSRPAARPSSSARAPTARPPGGPGRLAFSSGGVWAPGGPLRLQSGWDG